ncbi:MAG: hypothetical protein GF334_07190 [Candidatus Altiarchaeales archaeon]|nr:hypothetical protein [Candidatus Altiarchaeales archaeon]
MIGEGSGIVPDRGLNILYRVTLNTLMNLTDTDLTQDNTVGNTQKTNNSRLSSDTPKGLLAGSIVKVGTTSGTVVAADGSNGEYAVGVVINNAVGYPFESSSGVASGKCPYIHGSGTVFTTDLYETRNADNSADLSFSAADQLYVSQNGLLTNEASTSAQVIGVVLIAPSSTDPFMAVQMAI